jgi:hypothetical protein
MKDWLKLVSVLALLSHGGCRQTDRQDRRGPAERSQGAASEKNRVLLPQMLGLTLGPETRIENVSEESGIDMMARAKLVTTLRGVGIYPGPAWYR